MQDKSLLSRARQLRAAMTPFELILWHQLSSSRLDGHKFRRQHVIDQAIVSFFCPAKGLIVEVDGDTHDAVRDSARDRRHKALGYTTIRFTNAEVGSALNAVREALLARLESLPDRWSDPSLPHPHSASPSCPSPEGEGI